MDLLVLKVLFACKLGFYIKGCFLTLLKVWGLQTNIMQNRKFDCYGKNYRNNT